MTNLLNIKSLNVYFKTMFETKHVLKDINLYIKQNEILAVVGESGSGKSVMSKAIMGLLGDNAIKTGEIILHGSKLQDKPVEMLQLPRVQAQSIRGDEISMIFQDPMTSLNPLMTVGKQIAEAIRIHQGKSQCDALTEAGDLLERVRVPSGRQVLKVYPHQLSGGMRQRVMIAMALACRPKLLIADEPTTALDVTIQAQMLGLIKELQAELNMGVIFITHDMSVVHEIADRVAVMYKGEIVEVGKLKDVFLTPKHDYTQALLRAAPKLGEMTGRDLPHTFPVLSMEEELIKDDDSEELLEIEGGIVDYEQEPILTVSDLHVIFPRKRNLFGKVTHQVHAVSGVSFDLYKGETLGIVGESGSGKSTIGNAILGLLEEATGKIEYEGINLLNIPKNKLSYIRNKISFIFQDPLASLNPRMSIGASIAEPLIIHQSELDANERTKIVKDLLQKVGISPDLYNHYPHEFSGGMLQRVNIARALTTNPEIIIADESVSALDVSVQATVLNLMMKLQKELGVAFIFISHDMAVIERVCHRVAVMTKGQLVEIGYRREIFESTKHSYTNKLIDAIPKIDFESDVEKRFELITDEIPDPIYPVDVSPEAITMKSISESHRVAQE
ncbi:ABC transporter ATP-binding protein [Psychromonas sp. RZ22]|uniref:ABC transporter ATP-binding protein n=1 Tax=Psychromonas algarum TaxID=2555643 RepID=UPI00106786C2|nr:ABC transporter ATP-binding protein [Psychromonas sp. RZ22]TEW54307.1 ABC transporter ATP-binding protein [Psychromonas sp. RZ22]